MHLQRPASPSKFTSQATDSPSKLSVPSRKQRNQPSNRVHDIEFATEISQSLLAQVRQLQALLVERDEGLKAANLEKSRLELEAQGFAQRLRSLDESEQRYKDENWTLETQIHELIAAAKQSADKEQRLQQTLATTTSEKSAAQRELDDIKQAHGRLAEEHVAFRKGHEVELASLRKNITLGESDRASLHRKVEELTSQNQELARAVAGQFREEEEVHTGNIGSEPEELYLARSDAEHSPPGSPSKAMNRHSMLESETLKSSLNHAHRMIQNLKSNIHREKTEKLELKRMLQESRDELESRRGDAGISNNANKRLKSKSIADNLKKSSRLGMGRSSRTDIEVEDNDWEDHKGEGSPSRRAATMSSVAASISASDAYQTATEAEDAFETANERDTATENEAFMTGNESLAGDSSDDLTETEGGLVKGRLPREVKSLSTMTAKPGQRSSFISTASTSASDEERTVSTPAQQPQKYRLKINRNSRKSRIGSEGLMGSANSSAKNSPASFISTNGQPGQSLFAELGELNGDDSAEEMDGTPSRTSIISHRSIPASRQSTAAQSIVQSIEPHLPRLPMVDTGVMTDSWEPAVLAPAMSDPSGADKYVAPATPQVRDIGVQRTPVLTPPNDTSAATTPRKAWDAPLKDFVANIPTFGPALTSTPISEASGASREVQYNDTAAGPSAAGTPISKASGAPREVQYNDTTASSAVAGTPLQSKATQSSSNEYTETIPQALSFTSIQSLETKPTEPAPAIPSRDNRRLILLDDAPTTTSTSTDKWRPDSSKGGVIGSVLGWARNKRSSTPQPADSGSNQGSEKRPISQESQKSFKADAARAMPLESSSKGLLELPTKPDVADMADQGSQTILSAEQIDTILSIKASKPPSISPGLVQRLPASTRRPSLDIDATPAPLQKDVSQDSVRTVERPTTAIRENAPLSKLLKRPGSSGSVRTSNTAMPPLPPDHRQAIAAAAQRQPAADGTATIMGPPIAPASAYRSASARPRTPSEQRAQTQNARSSTTPRPRYSTARSQMSRRSSVTSFESELDQRFNIRTDGMPMPHGLDAGADPRMIQAITQTMIGEYLWKYTRKAGRSEMSDNRHRRFFWVHPYTRTLYWSDQDPATAGRAQLKAKSVAIEGVRVVTDDNPMPPGLHRKSLVILTPGRAVKFTATTGQRHETWFNSLSYLILRTGADPQYVDSNGLTAEDVAEFNPSLHSGRNRSNSRATRTSHVSLSSYNSRPVTASRQSSRQPSPSRAQSAMSARPNPLRPAELSQSSRYSEAKHNSVSSRFSSYLRPGHRASARGSMSSRQGEHSGENGAIYDASVVHVHDSAEDLRKVIEKQEEEADRLENVRACCDGELCLRFLLLFLRSSLEVSTPLFEEPRLMIGVAGKHDVGSLGKRGIFGGRMGSSASRHDHSHA